MQFLPKTRGERIRLAVLALLLVGVGSFYRLDRVAAYYLSDKAEGDVLFQSLPRQDLVDAIEVISQSAWSHCGILVRRDGRWYVAEAIGEVRLTPLHLWVVRGRRSVVVSYRLKDPSMLRADLLHAGIEEFLGRAYDYRYAPDDGEIYCSELVHKVYQRRFGLELGEWQKLGDLNWRPKEAFIRQMENGALPLGRDMVTPVSLTRSELVERVY